MAAERRNSDVHEGAIENPSTNENREQSGGLGRMDEGRETRRSLLPLAGHGAVCLGTWPVARGTEKAASVLSGVAFDAPCISV